LPNFALWDQGGAQARRAAPLSGPAARPSLGAGRPGNQSLAVKELGGTGRVHDWTLSARIRESAGVPLFLAGGLRAENVAEAVRAVEPFALDVCSGVRTDGALDAVKLRAFMAAASTLRSGRAPGGTRPARRRSAS